nr:diguanylate cyclase [uncultured Desulfuromonas sp.]
MTERNGTSDDVCKDLLRNLKQGSSLADFHFTLISASQADGGKVPPFCPKEVSSCCKNHCPKLSLEAVGHVLRTNKPNIFRCPSGFLNFALPVFSGDGDPVCLVGCGGREDSPPQSVAHLEKAIRSIQKILATAAPEKKKPAEKQSSLQALSRVSQEIDRITSPTRILETLTEALLVLFDLRQIFALFTPDGRNDYSLVGGYGLSRELEAMNQEDLAALFPALSPEGPAQQKETRPILPPLPGGEPVSIPMKSQDRNFGLLVLVSPTIQPDDLAAVRLLCDRTSTRLALLSQQEKLQKVSALSSQLLKTIDSFTQIKNLKELSAAIIHKATDLLQTSRGSLMLIDPSRENLWIAAARGMNPALARSLKVRVGTGIAGRVFQQGHPLLVTDVEKNDQLTFSPRPRFQTKSFISVPIKSQGHSIGVINLSDKRDKKSFSRTDLALLKTFTSFIAILLEQTTALERTRTLENQAITDPLTGLYNRRYLTKRLEEEFGRSGRQNFNFCIMLIDLDNFKAYNDLFGHSVGDEVLRKSAALIKSAARDMDAATRYGGDEFCILLPGTSKQEAKLVAERIRATIEKTAFPKEDRFPTEKLTISIGIAGYPHDGNTADALIQNADQALYRAKNGGRNRVYLFGTKSPQEKIVFL